MTGAASPAERDRRTDRRTLGWILIGGLAFLAVDVLSLVTEHARDGAAAPVGRLLLQEATGLAAFLLTAPAIGRLTEAAPPDLTRWRRFIPFHLAASLVLGALVVLVMVGSRTALYPPVLGETYIFAEDLPREFLYEYRKFALYYAGVAFLFTIGRQLADRRTEREADAAEARTSRRITLRDGGRSVLLEAADIVWLKSEANYVDVVTADLTIMVRGTLAELEAQLKAAGARAVRTHRSHVVNADHVREARPDGQGGLVLTLDTGALVPASRRYRPEVEAQIGAG